MPLTSERQIRRLMRGHRLADDIENHIESMGDPVFPVLVKTFACDQGRLGALEIRHQTGGIWARAPGFRSLLIIPSLQRR